MKIEEITRSNVLRSPNYVLQQKAKKCEQQGKRYKLTLSELAKIGQYKEIYNDAERQKKCELIAQYGNFKEED